MDHVHFEARPQLKLDSIEEDVNIEFLDVDDMKKAGVKDIDLDKVILTEG